MRLHQVLSPLVAVAMFSTGCAHSRSEKFEAALSSGRCEDALETIPENDGHLRYLGRVNRTAGTALSYAATGAGYTADVLVTVAGGAVVLVVLCAPMIAVAAAGGAHYYPGPGGPCLPADLSGLKPPHMGKDIYKGTEELRCPDLTALSRSVRRVASCEELKSERSASERAKKTLTSVTGNEEFMTCIATDERAALQTDLYRIENKLARSN